MAVKRPKPAPTKTLSFRVDAYLYDRIVESAKARDMSLGEYIMAQIDPMSELGTVIMQFVQANNLLKNEAVQAGLVEFVSGLVNLKEKKDLDADSFAEVLKGAYKNLIDQKLDPKK